MIRTFAATLVAFLLVAGTAFGQERSARPALEMTSVQLEESPEYKTAIRTAAEAETLLMLCSEQPAYEAIRDEEKVDLILLIRAAYARGLREVQEKLGDQTDGRKPHYGVFTDVLKLRELGCGSKAVQHVRDGYAAAKELESLAGQIPEDRQSAVRQVLGGAVNEIINTVFTHLQCLEGGTRPENIVKAETAAFQPFFDKDFDNHVGARSFVAMFNRHPMQFAYFDKLKAEAGAEKLDDPAVDKSCGPRVEIWESVKSRAADLAENTPETWQLDTTLGSEF